MEPIRVLLVDDEERFLSTTRKLLGRKGYDVTTASSGVEALNKLNEQPIHVVILDVKMPGMDGVATLKEIKRRHPLVEVIMLTGHGTIESAIEGLEAGATDYVSKPADLDELIQKTHEAYEKRIRIEKKIQQAHSKKDA